MKNKTGIIIWTICVMFTVFMVLSPLYIMFKNSVSDEGSIKRGPGEFEPFFPKEPTFYYYKYIAGQRQFLDAFRVSLTVAFLTVIFSIAIGTPAAYVLARRKFPGKSALLFFMLSIRLFPDISSVIPVVNVFLTPPLIYLPNIIQVALAHTLLALPYVLFMSTGVFEVIPKDLEEQAYTLGCSRFYTFTRIVMPLAMTGLAAAAIYTFLLSWNEFVFSYFLMTLTASSAKTLPVMLNNELFGGAASNIMAVISVYLSIPVIAFTFLVQKYIQSGMTSGAVK
ncbi:MAG: carbohydrate ABC transporter permease [Candidatus Eremiobacterota bacterium]